MFSGFMIFDDNAKNDLDYIITNMYVQDMLILMIYQQVSIISGRSKNALSSTERIYGKSTTYCGKSTIVLRKRTVFFQRCV